MSFLCFFVLFVFYCGCRRHFCFCCFCNWCLDLTRELITHHFLISLIETVECFHMVNFSHVKEFNQSNCVFHHLTVGLFLVTNFFMIGFCPLGEKHDCTSFWVVLSVMPTSLKTLRQYHFWTINIFYKRKKSKLHNTAKSLWTPNYHIHVWAFQNMA